MTRFDLGSSVISTEEVTVKVVCVLAETTEASQPLMRFHRYCMSCNILAQTSVLLRGRDYNTEMFMSHLSNWTDHMAR